MEQQTTRRAALGALASVPALAMALGWNAQKLATKAGVGINTVNRFESGASQPRGVTLEALRGALESAGVIFVEENGEGPGVRLRKAKAGGGWTR